MTSPAPREGGRRALHLATGALGVAAVHVPAHTATLGLAALCGGALLLETARFTSTRAHAAVGQLGAPYFRPHETRLVSGATALIAGYLLAWLLFPGGPAARGITVAAVSDPAASLVGRRFGRPAVPGRKTWIGTAAAFAAALLVLTLWRTAPLPAVLAALAAALVERLRLPGLDNIAVPVAAAAVLRFA